MSDRPYILVLELDKEKVEEIKVFGDTDTQRVINELKVVYCIVDDTPEGTYLFYLKPVNQK